MVGRGRNDEADRRESYLKLYGKEAVTKEGFKTRLSTAEYLLVLMLGRVG